jgi:hypothetical protein
MDAAGDAALDDDLCGTYERTNRSTLFFGGHMAELLDWLTQYSPPIALLIALGTGLLWVTKLIVERSITSGFDAQSRRLEMALRRRSAFEEQVLLERYALINSLSERLMRVMTNLNRRRSGQPVPENFMQHNEIVPLTEIFEEVEIRRLMMGEDFHRLFLAQSHLVLKMANQRTAEERTENRAEWERLQEETRAAAEEAFGFSKIRW